MPLIPVVEDINEIDESLRGHYKQTDQGFVLDVTPTKGFALENIEGLKSAKSKERAERQELEKKLKKFSSFGDVDPEEIMTKLAELEELRQLDPQSEAAKLADARVKSLQEQMGKKHTTELQQLSGQLEKYRSDLRRTKIDDAARQAIIAAGGNEKTVAFMLHEVKSKIDLKETENGFMAQVLDENGYPAVSDAQGTPMTIEDYVKSLRDHELWSAAFPGRNKTGGGRSSDGNGGTPKLSNIDLSTMTRREKMDLEKKIGPEEYRKLVLKS